jgi:AcrR family transcriptional regulator
MVQERVGDVRVDDDGQMASLLACYLLGEDIDVPSSLPRSRHHLDRRTVEASQRFRLLLGTARAAAAKGWAQTTVADIVDAAGVSRKTFYEHFDSRDEAFVAAYDAIDVGIERVASALTPEGDVSVLLAGVMRGLLGVFAADGDFTWMLCVEANAASPEIRDRRLATVRRLAELLAVVLARAARTDPTIPTPRLPVLIGLVGAINELVVHQLRDHGASRLVDLYPTVSRLTGAICLNAPDLETARE